MTKSIAALCVFLLPATASAFCGTYVGGAGTQITNSASEVVLVREGNWTTLTVSNDFTGDTTDFALVIPVPEVMPEGAIKTIDPAVIDRMDDYSSPRLVSYVCDDFAPSETDADTDSDTDSDTDWDGDTSDTADVHVEAEYEVDEYTIVILSATQSSSLINWLGNNGYAVSNEAEELLGEYLEAGSYFFAAKVSFDEVPEDGMFLSPIQFTYQADVFSLPIRIGTIASPGVQDLIVYAINSYDDGEVHIANYPKIDIESECMVDTNAEDFAEFYANQYTDAYEEQDGAAWAVEYSWGAAGCDPCTGTPPSDEDMYTLGYGQHRTIWDMYFTRLHMRYTKEAATQDLVLYKSGLTDQSQQRYVQYEKYLEDRFPVCGYGWRDNPGSCDNISNTGDDDDDDDDDDDTSGKKGAGCSAIGVTGIGLWTIVLFTFRRRK
jgi:hypothetical protein